MTAIATSLKRRAPAKYTALPMKGMRRAYAGIVVVGLWHALALTVLGVCLYVSGHAIATNGKVGASDLLPAAVAALVLLTLRPYGHKFVAPGPRLLRGEQPDVFAAMDEATAAVGVAPYDEVYVDGSARAEVIQRDGVFGFGGRRTLVIGSALLQTMTVDHLKALVAHEAAFYYGGDSKLAAFVERSRARMRCGLDEVAGGKGGLTSLPFATYAGFFLKSTSTLSREHCLATDDLVADAIGAWQLAEVLKMAAGLPAVLDAYGAVYAGPHGPRFEDFIVGEEATRALAFARFRESEVPEDGGIALSADERLARLHDAAHDSRPFDERPVGEVVNGFPKMVQRAMADRFARA